MYKAGKEHASSSNKSTVLINIKIYFLYVLIALQWNVDQVIASVNVINNTNTRPRKRTSVIHFSLKVLNKSVISELLLSIFC